MLPITLTAADGLLTHLWPWLPELTIALKFATALISFGLSVGLLARRLRRWTRRRRAR